MSPQTTLRTNAHLLEVAHGLTVAFDDVAAGSVLRCFSRAVVAARHSGVPFESLPYVAEGIAYRMLNRRVWGWCGDAAG